ncbi:MAG TPA: GNAT family N-acetyltransferase [Armatimonadetes bacterium]|jgi:amino-acid N-acetyltransferase|nr:GNAT family N-acetyltransferase [Armatimonadota bacterium]
MQPAVSPTIRPAVGLDILRVLSLLEDAGLPTAGLEDHAGTLFVLAEGQMLLGAVAFEDYHPDALLRSLVVCPQARGNGYGRRLLTFVLEEVARRSFTGAYGLTTTIPGLLQRFGFNEMPRDDLPRSLMASAELRGACPATARVFGRRLETT